MLFYLTIDYQVNKTQHLETTISYLNVVTNTADWNFVDIDIFYNWKFNSDSRHRYSLFSGIFINQEPLIVQSGSSSTERTDFRAVGISFGAKYYYQVTTQWIIGSILKLHLNSSFSGLPEDIQLESSVSIFPSLSTEFSLTQSITVGSSFNYISEKFNGVDGSNIDITGFSLEFFITLDL